jgi:hypothetical protein
LGESGMSKEQKKPTLLITFLIISIIANLLLMISIVGVESKWQNDYNRMTMGWCELSNDYVEIINDAMRDLAYYNSDYNNVVDLITEIDCLELTS